MSSDPASSPSHPIRIAFLSSFFYRHIIAQVTVGILEHLPRDRFEVIAIHVLLDPEDQTVVAPFADKTIRLLPTNLAEVQQAIAELELDVLVYVDIGMSPFTYLLAFARLAPVQCVMSGHPVTSGLSSIDYYLSTAFFEPENAQKHYTEKLVLQQSISGHFVQYPRSVIKSTQVRAKLGLTTERIYTCPVALFKFHPDFDAAILAILRADPDSIFVFIHRVEDLPMKMAFLYRIQQKAPEMSGRIHGIPKMEIDEFLGFLDEADAVLDSFYFGAGTTSLFALGIGIPLITLPGPFLRGRVAYGCYQAIGILDAVATDFDDYVAKAVRIAQDKAWRYDLQQRILERCNILFEQMEAIDELSAFFTAAYAAKRSGAPLIDWPPLHSL